METWWSEILAVLRIGITNAGSDGTNRVIKTIARDAYGFRNPENPAIADPMRYHPTSPWVPQPRSKPLSGHFRYAPSLSATALSTSHVPIPPIRRPAQASMPASRARAGSDLLEVFAHTPGGASQQCNQRHGRLTLDGGTPQARADGVPHARYFRASSPSDDIPVLRHPVRPAERDAPAPPRSALQGRAHTT
ncbi:transposase [Nonomuraea muscovyensis]|uniref:transposase n=1 Tax=Nonomuraea muscovyensis TaxID=1124761 RepID=UPI001C8837AC